jgi:hypothetical protein
MALEIMELEQKPAVIPSEVTFQYCQNESQVLIFDSDNVVVNDNVPILTLL